MNPESLGVFSGVIIAVLVAIFHYLWNERRRQRQDELITLANAAYQQWLEDTVVCPTCLGTGRMQVREEHREP